MQSINYSINNLIFNILDAVKKLKLPVSYRKDRHHDASDTNLDTPLQFLLDENSRLSDESKDFVVEIILVNLIITLLHKHFFKGEHFFGVGSETLYDYLETMLSKLVADGKCLSFKLLFYLFIASSDNNFSLSRKLGSYRNSALAFNERRGVIPDERGDCVTVTQ